METSTSENLMNLNTTGITVQQPICSICNDLPLAKIYQCKNSHVICQTCLLSSRKCQNCQEPLERARDLESIVKTTLISCPHQSLGCAEEVERQNLETHAKDCFYNGKHIKLCTKLGYNCSHLTNIANKDSITDHLQNHHNAVVANDNCLSVQIMNFENVTKNLKSDGIWTTMQINTTNGLQFIIQTVFHSIDESVSFVCFQVNQKEDFIAEYNIKVLIGSHFSRPRSFEWKIIPEPLWNSRYADLDIRRLAIQKIPVSLLFEKIEAVTEQNNETEYMLPVYFHVDGLDCVGTLPKLVNGIIPISKRGDEVHRTNWIADNCCPRRAATPKPIAWKYMGLFALTTLAMYAIAFWALGTELNIWALKLDATLTKMKLAVFYSMLALSES